jgi:hypothetical protein
MPAPRHKITLQQHIQELPKFSSYYYKLLQTKVKKKLEHYLSENYNKIIRFFVLGFISPRHQTSIISYGHFDIIN